MLVRSSRRGARTTIRCGPIARSSTLPPTKCTRSWSGQRRWNMRRDSHNACTKDRGQIRTSTERAPRPAERGTPTPWRYVGRSRARLREPRRRSIERQNFVHRSFKPLLKRAGLPDIHFHALRHTAASSLLTEGVHPKIVQDWLGHATIGATMDVYSHVTPGLQRDAAERLDRLFGGSEQAV
jgi:integrase